jgi:hypothetical protein
VGITSGVSCDRYLKDFLFSIELYSIQNCGIDPLTLFFPSCNDSGGPTFLGYTFGLPKADRLLA